MGSWKRTVIPLAATALLGLAITRCVQATLRVLAAPPQLRAGFLPDDAFYYLTLARNFDRLGDWTFDSGVSQTNGFHLLHAYALAGLHRLVQPGEEAFVQLAVLLTFSLFLAGALAAAFMAVRRGGLHGPLLLGLLLLSWNMQLNAFSGMEWSWVVLLSGGYCLALHRLHERWHRWAPLVLAALGFAGALARTDFGLLPLCLAAAALAARGLGSPPRVLWAALAGLTGAAAGTATVLLHGWFWTGQLLQSSARMKTLWQTSAADSVERMGYNLLSLLGPTGSLTLALAAVLAALSLLMGGLWLVRARRAAGAAPGAPALLLWIGSLLTVAGYFALYVLNADLQPWYTANLVVPLALLLLLPALRSGGAAWPRLAWTAALLVMLGDQAVATMDYHDHPTWPHAASMVRAGKMLSGRDLQGEIGSWNAGALGYYQGGGVVNLDGLVNNDIFDAARDDKLPEYIDDKGIRYLADYDDAFAPAMRKRGGFERPEFLRRLRVVRVFDKRQPGKWGGVTLYEIRGNGVERR